MTLFQAIFFWTGLISMWVFWSALVGRGCFLLMKLATVNVEMTEHTVVINSSPIDLFFFYPQDKTDLDIFHEVSKIFL